MKLLPPGKKVQSYPRMNYTNNTSGNNRTFHSAFQSRVMPRLDNKEAPTAYPAAFQQQKRDSTPRYGQQNGYQSWKRKEDVPVKPKEVNLSSTEDFPTLSGSTNVVVKPNPLSQSTTSLAERLKVVIQQEEEAATQRRYQKDTDRKEDTYISLNLSNHWQRKQLEKKEAYEAKQREIEEEERQYRRNMDPNPYPDDDSEYDDDHDNDHTISEYSE